MKQVGLIPGPVLEIDEFRARRNIRQMVAKAERSGTLLRPHFKTHQSLPIAQWFSEMGVTCCTVSSPAMAGYFSQGGWRDVLIALPAQPGAMAMYRNIAGRSNLGVISDSPEVVAELDQGMDRHLHFWIELDTGYGRTGADWQDHSRLEEIASLAESAEHLIFEGLLTHGGDTYRCRSRAEVKKSYQQSSQRLQSAAEHVQQHIGRKIKLSCGDTPACSVLEGFSNMDEMRPGNFVFYDLMQYQIGVCDLDDIAISLACPVLSVYPQRGEVAVHGGAVHFSKEPLEGHGYGGVLVTDADGKRSLLDEALVTSLSQEHGIIRGPEPWLESLSPGDVIRVLPIHSCLTMDCMLNSGWSSYESLRILSSP